MSSARGLLGLALLLIGLVTAQQSQRHADAFVENKSMQPCEDFHTYTCESQHKRPDGTAVMGFESLVSEAQGNLIAKLKGVVESEDYAEDGGAPLQMLRTFYKSCTNLEEIDEQGIRPISSVLAELGGWPLTQSPNASLADWQELDAFYGTIGVFPLYEVSVNSDAFRRTHTVSLRQPRTTARGALLQKPRSLQKYAEYVKSVGMIVAGALGARIAEQEVLAAARQVAAFEAEMMKILDATDRLEVYRPLALKKLQNLTSQLARSKELTINWVKVINKMHPTRLVSVDDVVDVAAIGYFPKLVQLLNRTPLRTIVNYIHWTFVNQFLPFTSKELRNLYFDMRNFMEDPIKNTTRWRLCGFEPTFDHVISFVFAKKYVTHEIEKSVHEILGNIKQITVRTIRNSFLLNEDEKQRAEGKVSSMSFVLGIPEPLKNFSVIANYYKKLSMSKNYFNNVLALKKFYKTKEFEVIKKPHFVPLANKNFLKITTISSIGSAYEFFENRVLIKIENFMAPLFDPNYPEYKKYGILGFIMAYEIMHAFNDADSIGNERPRRHLYSEATRLKYWNKIECFINQYDNYYIPNPLDPSRHLYVDGGRSAMENIADSAAIRIAFRAYRDALKRQGYSSADDDEEFFTSFASLLCRPELEEFYLSRFNFALRTLPRFRVVGSLSNTHEFARAFLCSNTTRMNPPIKCNFWN